jgi:hypothetical protein
MFGLQVPRMGQKYLTRLHCSNVAMVGIDLYLIYFAHVISTI